jgi:hypothetical protein
MQLLKLFFKWAGHQWLTPIILATGSVAQAVECLASAKP